MTEEQRAKLVSVVLPVCNEEGNVAEMLRRLRAMAEAEPWYAWEFIFVDDGSTDGTAPAVCAEARRDPRVKLVELTRNFGHQMAITAGLAESSGEAVITLDGDLQHPPEAIPLFLRSWEAGSPVVAGVRRAAAAGRGKDWSSRVFNWLLNRLSEVPIPPGAADFRLMDRRVVDAFLGMGERARFLRGMVSWMGYETGRVEYDEQLRSRGRSKFSLGRMTFLATDAITSFSALPLRVATLAGLGTTCAAALYGIYVLVAFAFRPEAVLPGWASTVLVSLLLGGIQLLFLGVIGEYLHRIYDEVKARPLYVVKRRVGLDRRQARHSS
jgi:dolichol-phosphate mannosyltransferase